MLAKYNFFRRDLSDVCGRTMMVPNYANKAQTKIDLPSQLISSKQGQGLSSFIQSKTKKGSKNLLLRSVFDTSASSDCGLSLVSKITEATSITKNVRFSTSVIVRRTIPLSRYTRQELKACWFTDKEYTIVAQNCAKQVNMIEKGDDRFKTKANKYCSRGLEQHTKFGSMIKKKTRFESIETVITEQERQDQEGIIDEFAIVRLYRLKTSSSQLWAHVIGMRDQRHAFDDDDDDKLEIEGGYNAD